MTTLPAGTVTLLSTDIEGSTKLLDDSTAADDPALAWIRPRGPSSSPTQACRA
jgi:hypothetical protein